MKRLLLALLLVAGCHAHRPPAIAPAPPPANDEAALHAQTLANAMDTVEADHAEKALLDIGPSAAPAIRNAMQSANAPARARLQRLLDQLEPASSN